MTNGFSIRIAMPADAAAVTELITNCYATVYPSRYSDNVLRSALPRMSQANASLLQSGRYYVAQEPDSRMVGCGGWSFARPGSGEIEPQLAHIRHFATHPERLRRGIARAIYARCRRDARPAGVERFECLSALTAEEFYRSLGLATVRHIQVDMGDGIQLPAILMTGPV